MLSNNYKKRTGKLYSLLAGATCGLFATLATTSADAARIDCSNLSSQDISTDTYVRFHPTGANTGTCDVVNNSDSVNVTGKISFYTSITSSAVRLRTAGDNDLGMTLSVADHNGVTNLGGSNFAAGVAALTHSTVDGTYTTTITSAMSATTEAVMTVSYTVSNTPTRTVNITEAYVTVPGGDDAEGDTNKASRELQTIVSRSQSTIVSTNIGSRVANIGDASFLTGGAPSGTARTTPTPDNISTDTQTQANFASLTDEYSSNTTGYEKLPLRQLAMAMSFDSSSMVLAAAGNDKTPDLSPEKRASLLAQRPITIWGHGSFTDVKNTKNDTNDDNRYSGDVWGYNLGGDYRLNSKLYVGASVGFNQTDLKTTFNSGTYDEDNWSITPYLVYKPIEAVKLSAMVGYGTGKIDQTRNSRSVTSSTDSESWFASLNGSYTYKPNKDIPLDLKASVGLLATNKTVDSFTESDGTFVAEETANTRQVKPGLEAAYSHTLANGTTLQPFVKTAFLIDLMDKINDDSNAFDVGGGLRIGSKTGFSGALEGKTQLGRDDYKEFSVNGLIAYSFALAETQNRPASFVEPYVSSDFNEDAQTMGTGIKFRSYNDAVNAKLSLDHAISRNTGNNESSAKVLFGLNF